MNITASNFYARPKYLSSQISEHYSLRSVKMFCKCAKRNLQFLFQAMSYMEDVFSIILAWINHDKNKRRSHFPVLFRQVRLVYVSRDFLCSDVVTNELVKNNEDCLELAKGAIDLIDSVMSLTLDTLHRKPRKCLNSSAIVAYKTEGKYLFYFPREDRW